MKNDDYVIFVDNGKYIGYSILIIAIISIILTYFLTDMSVEFMSYRHQLDDVLTEEIVHVHSMKCYMVVFFKCFFFLSLFSYLPAFIGNFSLVEYVILFFKYIFKDKKIINDKNKKNLHNSVKQTINTFKNYTRSR